MAELKKSKDKVIAGVCGGLAKWLGWDMTLTRIIYTLLTIGTAFAGVIIYIILWIVMPNEQYVGIHSKEEYMIKVGDKLPNVAVKVMGKEGPEDVHTDTLFAGKKVVLFAVPGAFTPTCSAAHLPGFVVNFEQFKEKGVDTVACMSVNDAFVMDAWGKDQNAENLLMVADGNADFSEALGLDADATAYGMGVRSKRFALIAEDGVVTTLEVDDKGLDKSSAEHILTKL